MELKTPQNQPIQNEGVANQQRHQHHQDGSTTILNHKENPIKRTQMLPMIATKTKILIGSALHFNNNMIAPALTN